jgi:hypothetical protein
VPPICIAVARIDRKVEHRELELGRVGHRGPEIAREAGLDANAAAHRALQQLVHAGDRLVEVERARLEPLAARERQHLVGQLGAALGGGAHMVEPALDLAVDARGGELAVEEADIAEHDGQEVVEVVRHAGGELADRLEPLHLAQRRLDALALLHLAAATGGSRWQARRYAPARATRALR